ncbi:MAG: TRAP transporter large permease [Paracoccus sp. (in: a-proteobacteria)]|uniref:TRAP transporter large permease n=1 Tax=Paracoccus sp. TaxID=267 RepID=UPI0026DFD6B6|nr:TRAP transporter large permease [Paracoccus sp. (in: a-proteobacteria)]MDO5622751.1 TRAP transporter large permease [Paracoccus sp. (in: a-proteobacteria)]
MIAALGFAGLLGIGAPIAFVLIAAALILLTEQGSTALLPVFPQQLFAGIENYSLLALPLFILLGELMGAGGIGRRLLALAQAIMPPFRAGLAHVNLLANLMMSALLGSTVAQLTVMSRLAVPEMERAGYPRDMATAITAAGGLLAPVVPPSMNLIVFAAIAQLPVADLFLASVWPGLAMGLAFTVVICWLGRRHGLPRVPAQPAGARLRAGAAALPALVVPVVAVGSILGGIATPTESAAMAIVAALVVGGPVYRQLRLADLPGALTRTALTSGAVLFLVAAAQVLGWVVTFGNLPAMAAEAMQQIASSPLMFLLLMNVALLLIGTVMEPIPAIILTAPVLLPVATTAYGIDPVSFGVILCLNLALGLLTPPVGAGLYTAALLTGVRAERLSRLLLPFFTAVLGVLLAMTVLAARAAT